MRSVPRIELHRLGSRRLYRRYRLRHSRRQEVRAYPTYRSIRQQILRQPIHRHTNNKLSTPVNHYSHRPMRASSHHAKRRLPGFNSSSRMSANAIRSSDQHTNCTLLSQRQRHSKCHPHRPLPPSRGHRWETGPKPSYRHRLDNLRLRLARHPKPACATRQVAQASPTR